MREIDQQIVNSGRVDQGTGAYTGTIIRRWLIAFLFAAVVFYRPLRDLIRFAVHSELYSHVLLIPAIGFFLVWINRRTFQVSKPSVGYSLLGYVPAVALVGLYFATASATFWQVKGNYLSIMTVALVCLCIGNLFVLLGKDFVKSA